MKHIENYKNWITLNDNYRFFCFDENTKKIVFGSEYRTLAIEQQRVLKNSSYTNKRDTVVYSDSYLKSNYDIDPTESDNWETIVNESVKFSELFNFFVDFGILITMNFAKLEMEAKDESSKKELKELMRTIRQPIINGKSYSEMLGDKDIKNPKISRAILEQISKLINYIEPRIKLYVNEGEAKLGWLSRIDKLKSEYKKIINYA